MSKRVIMALRNMKERTRFMKGLFAWVGFSSTEVLYERHPRHAGESKWNYTKLIDLAIEGIVGYTTAPLRISTILGLVIAMTSLIYGVILVGRTIIWGNPVPGYPSIIVAILFLGGMQLLCMGIIGEYLARIFTEAKKRPIYLLLED
jgi:glycosyltransferase involved in cell wall biosynthesis